MKLENIKILIILVFIGFSSFIANAETFGTEAQPVIKQIDIHNVTSFNSSERENKDNLVDSIKVGKGSDTLNISRYGSSQAFRYDFKIVNGGDTNWNISNDDKFFHNGIDSNNWSINTSQDVWYQIENGDKRRGGNIESNTLNWNTSNGGVLKYNQSMEGSYIFETSQNNSKLYQQNFRIENNGSNAGSFYSHNTSLETVNPGTINITLYEPPEDTRLQVNKTFEANASVECYNGECGDVDVSIRYNSSSNSFVNIGENKDRPFYTIGNNTKTCANMKNSDSCIFDWKINATGKVGSKHKIDANASSQFSTVDSNSTEKRNVTLDYFLIISDNRNKTTFGVTDPNTTYNPAEGNLKEPPHQITVDNYSQPVDELFFGVSNLTSYYVEGYRIGPSNISYNFVNDTSTSMRASGSYETIKTNIMPGETVELFYWLDVPSGIVQDYYNGTMYFAAGSKP